MLCAQCSGTSSDLRHEKLQILSPVTERNSEINMVSTKKNKQQTQLRCLDGASWDASSGDPQCRDMLNPVV